MDPQRHTGQKPKRNPKDQRQAMGTERQEAHAQEAHAKAEQAARSVMHPDTHDTDWRYYYGALGG